jgi:hypothetical protein
MLTDGLGLLGGTVIFIIFGKPLQMPYLALVLVAQYSLVHACCGGIYTKRRCWR